MVKQNLLSILITFAIGLFAGFYLYLTGFMTYLEDSSVPDMSEVSELTIVSDIYGACGNECPSFQVTGDGSYRYFYTRENNTEPVLREGKLPRNMQRKIRNVLEQDELESQSRPISGRVCNSESGGNDVTYEITVEGQEYVLDSCETAVLGSGELWTTLNSIWAHLRSLNN